MISEDTIRPSEEDLNAVHLAVSSYLTQARVRSNRLVGKGVILTPEFKFAASIVNSSIVVLIVDSNKVKLTVACNRVVVSPYRSDISFVLDQNHGPPVVRRLVPLQAARQLMLAIVPPGHSLPAQEFYNRSPSGAGNVQVNARRRWGELRTEYGFETTYSNGLFERGQESPVSEPNPRPDTSGLNRDFWSSIYSRENGVCNKCGRPIANEASTGSKGLLDHRQPVPYGGTDQLENLQLFCTTCNNLKGTVCNRCPYQYKCGSCTWAYPEKFHDAIVVNLEPDDVLTLRNLAAIVDVDPRTLATQLLVKAIRNQD